MPIQSVLLPCAKIEIGSEPVLYMGVNWIDMLIDFFNREVIHTCQIYDGLFAPCHMSKRDHENFHAALFCEMCGEWLG